MGQSSSFPSIFVDFAAFAVSGWTGSTSVVDVELAGKTVLLTGATGGLGRAMASALADRGASLILSSRKPEELDRLAASLPRSGHRTIVSDLAEEGAALALLAEAGEIDALVANAALPVQMTRELIPAFTAREGQLDRRAMPRQLRADDRRPLGEQLRLGDHADGARWRRDAAEIQGWRSHRRHRL